MGREPGEARRRRRAGGSLGRVIGVAALVPLAARAPIYARLVWSLASDRRMPGRRKAVLAAGLGYLLLRRDLVPDDIPLLGGMDDLVVVALAVETFLDWVPADLLDEKLAALRIARGAYDRDVARIRRLTPGPLRRLVRRLPNVIDLAGGAWRGSGIGPGLRAWITREDSLA